MSDMLRVMFGGDSKRLRTSKWFCVPEQAEEAQDFIGKLQSKGVSVKSKRVSAQEVRDTLSSSAIWIEGDEDEEVENEPSDPVRTETGEPENFMPKVDGQSFRCECGCNVFQKPYRTRPEVFQCNGCGERYIGE